MHKKRLAPLALAFAASWALHLGATWLLPKRGPPPAQKGPLLASPALQWVDIEEVFLPPPQAPPSGGGHPAPTLALAAAPAPTQRRPAPLPSPAPLPTPQPPPPPSLPLATLLPQEGAGDTPGEADNNPGEAGGSPGPAGGNLEQAGGGPGEAGGNLGQAGEDEGDLALQQRLQAHALGCYPVRARRFRFQGTVRLGFCVDGQGMATHTRLLQGSGYGSLDKAALECVLKKAQPLPASSHGRCFAAPIRFQEG